MDVFHGGLGGGDYHYSETTRGKPTAKEPSVDWEAKAKRGEAALAYICNQIGTARELKKIAKEALDDIRRE